MNNTVSSVKNFFAGFWGRAVLIAALYVVIFGIIFALAMLNVAWVAVVLAVAFIYFGWKALSKITPNIFVIMPVGKWITYYVVKGFLSFFLGLFVAPFIIGKWLARKISAKCAETSAE